MGEPDEGQIYRLACNESEVYAAAFVALLIFLEKKRIGNAVKILIFSSN